MLVTKLSHVGREYYRHDFKVLSEPQMIRRGWVIVLGIEFTLAIASAVTLPQ